MDLHQLEYIVEIADVHGISRAANNLHITQSTLSQYLGRVESELGMRLFERKRNDVILTAAGELYVEACRRILKEKKELYDQLAELSETSCGNFSIGITPQWGAVAYAHIIDKFRQHYPNVTIHLREEPAGPLMQLLSERQVDMAIIPFENDMSLVPNSIFLHSEELLLAIPREHSHNLPFTAAADGLRSIDISAMADEPMIFSRNDTTIRKLQDSCCRSANLIPRIVSEINSHPASLIMVEKGIGSTFVPVSCAVPSDRIIYTHVRPLVQWFIFAAVRKGFILRQSEKYFIQLAREYFSLSALQYPG